MATPDQRSSRRNALSSRLVLRASEGRPGLPDEKTPQFYGNLVQVTRTPWDVTLHILRAQVPRNVKAGDIVNVVESAEPVITVTLPLEVGRALVEVLKNVTAEGAVRVVEEKVTHGAS